ncbi:MAG: hypothetical protein HY927_01755 [Elusimicrobia bacterium]|nr:hypothetical protein [Elusimicrobiota bacterium]
MTRRDQRRMPFWLTVVLPSLLLAAAAVPTASRAAEAAGSTKFPDWVIKGSMADKGTLIGVSAGRSHQEAVIHAFGELAKEKKALVKEMDIVSVRSKMTSRARADFGPIAVSQFVEDAMGKEARDIMRTRDAASKSERALRELAAEEARREGDDKGGKAADGDLQAVRSLTKVALALGKKTCVFESEMESLTGSGVPSEESSTFSETSDGLSFADLLKEMGRQGITMRTFEDPADGTHFVYLQAKAP